MGCYGAPMSVLLDYLAALSGGLQTALKARGARRWRRLLYLSLYVVVLPPVWAAGVVALALDQLLYPGWKRQPLDRPLFVVGNHRTGSTFLHRLLAEDTALFACFRLYQLVLPAVVQKRFVSGLARLDAALGGGGARLVRWLDARWGNEYRKVHAMGINLPEEDEYLLFYRMASAALWETFPDVPRLRRMLEALRGE